MPCFKGIAVSIHANGAPLPEYGIQRQSRLSRINTYIPVPPQQIGAQSNKPEPAKFAISITLLTPGMAIPYSQPRPTTANPSPEPQYVGPMFSPSASRARSHGVTPYIPMTHSENETIAAYIYFDGRPKEEVATLLRPSEETWVNSRWVQVPVSEGGGLAEREFLFREVALETWLNGLDLTGHDAAERLERRRQKFETRRRREREAAGALAQGRDTLRYGNDDHAPLEPVDPEFSDDSDDEPPESTGQIKVAMYRVLASGEIKKGEYSPQYGAHDDSDAETGDTADAAVDGSPKKKKALDTNVEHTTSFAKPRTLDPASISTQTVTGLDSPGKPYAVFTFFYRGERQLQKLGILSSRAQQMSTSQKRRSGQLDFSNLAPLKPEGTVGFTAFRDEQSESARRRKSRKKSIGDSCFVIDSDSENENETGQSSLLGKMDDDAAADKDVTPVNADDSRSQQLADGVGRIRLKRAHSPEPGSAPSTHATPAAARASATQSTPPKSGIFSGAAGPSSSTLPDESIVGSPLKKVRADGDSAGDQGALLFQPPTLSSMAHVLNQPPASPTPVSRASSTDDKPSTPPAADRLTRSTSAPEQSTPLDTSKTEEEEL